MQVEADYKRIIKRALLLKDDSMAEELIKEEENKYLQISGKLKKDVSKLGQTNAALRININNIRKLNEKSNLYSKMHDVRKDRGLIKTMVDEYIEKIIIYRMHKLWFLVVIKYKNGVELWGKLKNARYKNDELFYDEFLCKYGVEFQTWIIDNTDHSFVYDKERKLILYNGKSELYQDLERGEYDYDSMNQYMIESQWMGRKGSIKSNEQKKEEYKEIIQLLKKGYSVRNVAKISNRGISTVQRIKTDFCL